MAEVRSSTLGTHSCEMHEVNKHLFIFHTYAAASAVSDITKVFLHSGQTVVYFGTWLVLIPSLSKCKQHWG